ncbi:UDP-N-acetylmuramoyl-L-alanine--D-glutamate ligase [Candidatus Saccharibacteria bacterium]|nr:UDP-N-acetylmuramoyl-L-alanine--D-glutamate ligase [Candidatus Saccharibacteria bacterium]
MTTRDARVAILGYGVEGQSVERYFRGWAEIKVFDEKNGVDFEKLDFSEFDYVFRSPSVRPDRIETERLSDGSKYSFDRVTSATRYFFEKCPAKIIGVTGTKGKGTTCSLIAEILKAAGRKVWLVGNIGAAALDVLDEISGDDIVVYELSSFQLWDMTRSPHVAVVVHMESDHMDVHKDMAEYAAAKGNIARWQREDDVVVYDKTNPMSTEIAELSQGQKVGYPTGEFEELLNKLVIPGEHNRMNGEAAILAVRAVGVEDEKAIADGLGSFTGLPHRLKFVREVEGVKYYDDSISTTPGSAIAAIRAFAEPKILILGGSSKGADFHGLAEVVRDGNVKKVVLVGPEGEKLEQDLIGAGYEKIVRVTEVPYDMKNVVKITTETAEDGDVVILSPACASFDSFKNYADRGDQFIAAVEAI